jgi:hypothetical protein
MLTRYVETITWDRFIFDLSHAGNLQEMAKSRGWVLFGEHIDDHRRIACWHNFAIFPASKIRHATTAVLCREVGNNDQSGHNVVPESLFRLFGRVSMRPAFRYGARLCR